MRPLRPESNDQALMTDDQRFHGWMCFLLKTGRVLYNYYIYTRIHSGRLGMARHGVIVLATGL